MSKDDGGPAFPANTLNVPFDEVDDPKRKGMALRDYFAAHAPEPNDDEIDRGHKLDRGKNPHNSGPPFPKLRDRLEIVTQLRYQYADAMLKARKENDDE